MLNHPHRQATTTPKVRAAIQASDVTGTVLAGRVGATPQTIYKWRNRDSVKNRSHRPHRLRTTLTPIQEAVAVMLRATLLLLLDDLLAVVRDVLNPNLSRSGPDPVFAELGWVICAIFGRRRHGRSAAASRLASPDTSTSTCRTCPEWPMKPLAAISSSR